MNSLADPDSPRTIALILDFDDTLCPDSTTAYLDFCGVDTARFWKEADTRVNAGYDPVLGYLQGMLELAGKKKHARHFLATSFSAFAAQLTFYPGVLRFFATFPAKIARRHRGWKLQVHLISSGLFPILNASPIARFCTGIYASDFQFHPRTGRILHPKRTVNFTDKTRILFSISKGLRSEAGFFPDPFAVNTRTPEKRYAIPFHRMIYLGDGYSDIPAFTLLRAYGGYGIAVSHEGRTQISETLLKEERVARAATPDFRPRSPIPSILMEWIDHIVARESRSQKSEVRSQNNKRRK